MPITQLAKTCFHVTDPIRASLVVALCLALPTVAAGTNIVDFEDLPLAPGTFYNGSDFAGGFTSHGAFFNNTFTDFGSFTAWQGWSYSRVTDQLTVGPSNQYAAFQPPNGGGDGSSNFAVGFAFSPGDAVIELPNGRSPASVSITNTTWVARVLLEGDPFGFAKKFGGPSGNDPDFFRLTITGLDEADAPVGAVEFLLADYQFSDNSQDFVIDEWTTVDLTSLASATKLSFGLDSTDNSDFGMTTPAYFALDNLVLVPEPQGFLLLALGGAAVPVVGARYRRRRRNVET